jgi:hypothetical protein
MKRVVISIPEDIYQAISRQASKEHRSERNEVEYIVITVGSNLKQQHKLQDQQEQQQELPQPPRPITPTTNWKLNEPPLRGNQT